MLPAQPKVENDLQNKVHSFTEAAAHAANSGMVTKSLSHIHNSEDSIIEVEGQFDEEIKSPECVGNHRVAAKEDPDATDYSSSFEGTMSGTENGSGLSDAEVESCFYDDNGFAYDGFNSIFPIRKKLTTHWRSFIRPLMWRCRWTELRIKEFQSLVSKYARELAAYDQRKQLERDQCTLESFCSKLLPFSFQSPGKKVMERRRRKRVEDTTDIASYMSQHNLFSYFDKRSDPDGTSMVEDIGNPVSAQQNADDHDEFDFGDDCVFHDYNDENDSLEQMLWKIERAQTHVEKLKSRLVEVFAENDMQFFSFGDLPVLVPYDGQASSNHSPTFSAGHEDMELVGFDVANLHDIADFIIPEFMAQSYKEAVSVPDIIESTVSPLSSADVTMNQPQIGDFGEASMDNVLAYDQAAEVERHTSRSTQKNTTGKLQEQEECMQESGNRSVPDIEPDLGAKTETPLNPSSLTSCLASEIHFPKSKRKRAERKVGLGRWSTDPLLRNNQ
ncbi:uncharacterized protein LOC127788301 isoform X3 [Diospyros lotus]|uniref:uncharacterized protein LOC127788301 isoform X3 n=1 Tax=Diospyros lotus TaxID=55363 RepID=UPI00224F05B2|nr:uncharacterized protein LOC127788301 isoform X3 [Diospyros lotus]